MELGNGAMRVTGAKIDIDPWESWGLDLDEYGRWKYHDELRRINPIREMYHIKTADGLEVLLDEERLDLFVKIDPDEPLLENAHKVGMVYVGVDSDEVYIAMDYLRLLFQIINDIDGLSDLDTLEASFFRMIIGAKRREKKKVESDILP
jgi:hypothetical protein